MQNRIALLRLALLTAALGTLGANACATNFTIADGDVAGLIAAINTANSNHQDDTITLAVNGIYTLTAVDNSVSGGNGLPRIGADSSHALTIEGNGATIQRDPTAPAFRILYTNGGSRLTLNDLTIQNGNINGGFGGSVGATVQAGGIWHNGVALTLNRCALSKNAVYGGNGSDTGGAAFGGGILHNGAALTLTDCLLSNNSASGGNGTATAGGQAFGGGIFFAPPSTTATTLTLTRCTLSDNAAIGGLSGGSGGDRSGGNAFGGGIFAGSFLPAFTLTMSTCILQNNQARGGSAAVGLGSDLGGSASGGGVCNSGGVYSVAGALAFTGCLLRANSAVGGSATYTGGAASGAGIYNAVGTLMLVNSVLTANAAQGGDGTTSGSGLGAGVYNQNGAVTVTSCTLAVNSASAGSVHGLADGGAIYSIAINQNGTATTATVTLKNSILALSQNPVTGGGTPSDLVAERVAEGPSNTSSVGASDHNLVMTRAARNGATIAGSPITANPRLCAARDNGGPVPTMALTNGSPAINAGSIDPNVPTDARGVARTEGTAPDIGAFETLATPQVLTIDPAADGAGAAAELLEAVRKVQTSPVPASITLYSKGVYTLTAPDNNEYGPNGLPQIGGNVTIYGNGATIQRSGGNGTPKFRLLYVSGGLSYTPETLGLPAGDVTLNNLTLSGGLAQGGNSGLGGGGAGMGGAIFCQGTLTLNGVTLMNNTAQGGASNIGSAPAGGGIGGDANGNTGGGFGGPFAGVGAQGGHGYTSNQPSGSSGGGGGGTYWNYVGNDGSVDLGGKGGGMGMLGGSFGSNFRMVMDHGDGGSGGAGSTGTDGGGYGLGGTLFSGGGIGGGGGGFDGTHSGGSSGGGCGGFGGGGGLEAIGGFGGGGGEGSIGHGGYGAGAGATNVSQRGGGGGAGLGGAVFCHRGILNMTNCTLTANTAQGGPGANGGSGLGAGVFNLNGAVTLNACTFAANNFAAGTGGSGARADGGALYNLAFGNKIEDGTTSSATVTLMNTILATSLGGRDLLNERMNGMGSNLARLTFTGENLMMTLVNLSGGITGSPTVFSDPMLGPLQDNGGPVWTMALSGGSPALDRVSGTSGVDFPAADARGVARPQGAKADLGAFELVPAVTVSGTVTLDSMAPSAAAQTLTFTFRPSDNSGDVVRMIPVAPNGQFSIAGLPRKNYTLHIKGAKWLAANVAVNASAGDVTGVTVTLAGGDANNDNRVDVADFGILINAYSGLQSDPTSGYDARADFTCDGAVDIVDFSVLINNYSSLGDP